MYDDVDDDDDLLPEQRDADPIAIAGLALVGGTTAYLALNAWTYWDQYNEGAAVADRLRTVAFVVNPYAAALVLLGITVARLRPFLGIEPANLDPRPAHTARRLGFLVAAIAATGAWIARCSPRRPAASLTPGPPDDFDPGDFDPATFTPYAAE